MSTSGKIKGLSRSILPFFCQMRPQGIHTFVWLLVSPVPAEHSQVDIPLSSPCMCVQLTISFHHRCLSIKLIHFRKRKLWLLTGKTDNISSYLAVRLLVYTPSVFESLDHKSVFQANYKRDIQQEQCRNACVLPLYARRTCVLNSTRCMV